MAVISQLKVLHIVFCEHFQSIYFSKHVTQGDIAGCMYGSMPVVVISDQSLLKEVFKMNECAERPALGLPFHKLRFGHQDGNCRGILFSNGEEYMEQRRFTLRSLKDHGFGKLSMEDSINRDVDKLISNLRNQPAGKPI